MNENSMRMEFCCLLVTYNCLVCTVIIDDNVIITYI